MGKKFSVVLIFLNCLLLGIWSLDGTIALRNALMVLGAILSILYIHHLNFSFNKINKDSKRSLRLLAPLLAMIIWAITHFLLFSQYIDLQYAELVSTWPRCFIAILMGFTIGVIVSDCPLSKTLWLFYGILFSFLLLIFKFIFFEVGSIGVVFDFLSKYSYSGKANAVLMGSILTAAAISSLFEVFDAKKPGFVSLVLSFSLLSISCTLFSYLVILDTRNGILIPILMILFFIAIKILLYVFKKIRNKRVDATFFKYVATGFSALILFSACIGMNERLHIVVEDISIALDIDKNQHWKNPSIHFYPLRNSEQASYVDHSLYSRVAWSYSGLNMIQDNFLGKGVLTGSYGLEMERLFPEERRGNPPQATHSGWIDLTLAFGIPGLIFMLGANLMAIQNSIYRVGLHSALSFAVSTTLMFAYLLGEFGSKHTIEVMFYFLAFCGGLGVSCADNA